uniref:leucine-rich repeat extensin-like protein 5 n=1 Tax=Solea senegalensis TaxID=28829 RepID=UPI001CD845D0|nr:leucine-rich repeat extensin-like protein 5 [Solea senegalensis]
MREGKMTSATSYLTVGLLLTCALAQTIHGFRLRRTGRREGRIGARTTGVQEGKVVFGRVFEKVTGRESPSNSSVDDESAYQADSPVNGQGQSTSSRDAAWKRMASSLQCGGDQMRFKAVGAGASNFVVDQGKAAPPMALSQVPSTCGYTMQRNPFALLMLVPYDGCNVVQEGGNYVLPMRWQGIPVSLCCPKPAEPSPEPQLPTKNPQEPQTTVTLIPPKQEPLNPQSQMYYWHYPYNVGPLPDPTPAPTTTTTTTTTTPTPTTTPGMQKIIQYPFFYPQNVYFPNLGQAPAEPTTKPPPEPQTTLKIPPQLPPQYHMQFPPGFPLHFPPQFPQQLPKLPPQFLQQLPPQFLQQLPPQFPQQLLLFPPQKDFIPYPTTPATTTTTLTAKQSQPAPLPYSLPRTHAPFPLYVPYGPYRT